MADQFTVPLEGWIVTHWNAEIVRAGSNGVDVFPSLHCGVTSFILLFDWSHKPWRFWAYVVPCVGLWVSTVYLRYHYIVDLVAGFALSAFALYIAHRYGKTLENPHELPATV
jgi:membrane-associated phospholipid phosphatase